MGQHGRKPHFDRLIRRLPGYCPTMVSLSPSLPGGGLTFQLRGFGAVVTVSIAGELDLTHVDRVERAVANVDLRPVQTLEVDLTATTFIDSCALGWLLRLRDRARHASTALVVVVAGEADPVRHAIEVVGLDRSLRLVSRRGRAMAG
jgi:anti-anti-sigma factor